jgi:phenylpyruvate tautomerase PptA (4-oxalocrotonate tautomerase family)
MPMIDLTVPAGALEPSARDALMHTLTKALLRWEGAPDNANANAISWGFVDERPAERLYQGGEPHGDAAPRYRLVVTIPDGVLDDERKGGLVQEMTRHVLETEGADPADPAALARVWVIVNEVKDGNWGGAGQVFRLKDIARFVYQGEPAETAGSAA